MCGMRITPFLFAIAIATLLNCTTENGLQRASTTEARLSRASTRGKVDLMLDSFDASLPAGFRHQVMLSSGTAFGAAGSGPWSRYGNGSDVMAGDFNGDAKTDMLVYWPSGLPPTGYNYDVGLSTGSDFSGAGNWAPNSGATKRRLIGDFNGDGRDDLLLDYPDPSSPVGFRHGVLLSNGSTGFNAAGSGFWAQGYGDGDDVVVGDFNGDGRTDLLIYWQYTTYRYDVILSNGTDFVYSANWAPTAGASTRRVIGDFNGDGRDDLMLDSPDASLPTGFRHQVLLSNGTSAFDAAGSGAWALGAGNAADIVAGDFSGDGKSDLLIYSQSGATTYNYDVWVDRQRFHVPG